MRALLLFISRKRIYLDVTVGEGASFYFRCCYDEFLAEKLHF